MAHSKQVSESGEKLCIDRETQRERERRAKGGGTREEKKEELTLLAVKVVPSDNTMNLYFFYFIDRLLTCFTESLQDKLYRSISYRKQSVP